LSGSDAHLFVKNLNSMGEGNIDCIPNTEENTSVSQKVFKMKKEN